MDSEVIRYLFMFQVETVLSLPLFARSPLLHIRRQLDSSSAACLLPAGIIYWRRVESTVSSDSHEHP